MLSVLLVETPEDSLVRSSTTVSTLPTLPRYISKKVEWVQESGTLLDFSPHPICFWLAFLVLPVNWIHHRGYPGLCKFPTDSQKGFGADDMTSFGVSIKLSLCQPSQSNVNYNG